MPKESQHILESGKNQAPVIDYECTIRELDQIHGLSQKLAQYFPHPEQCIMGIYELLLNAVEHGNLGIGFEEKSALLSERRWQEEVARRQTMPEYAEKKVAVKLAHTPHFCALTITDQGKGFPWRDYVGRPPSSKRPNGRGLWIAFNSDFDRVMFNTVGNEVTCMVQHPHSRASMEKAS